jgi:hypothetical protein
MITNNVMKIDEFPDAVYYRTACSCGDPECDMTLELEYDEEFNDVSLHVYKTLSWNVYWGNGNWFSRFRKRLTGAAKMLCTGRIEVSGDLLIQNKEHLKSFIDALQEGIHKLDWRK